MKKVNISGIVGNESLISYLTTAIGGGSFSHAYIIEGADGSGRHTILNKIISALACEGDTVPCNTCSNCLRIAEGNCIDVHYIRKDESKASLGVDVIRGIFSVISLMPNDLDFHVFIIEEAQLMTEGAQNAFLKILEEPPFPAYFFLITTSATVLLPTIRSRAQVLATQRLSPSEMIPYLKNKTGASDKKVSAAALLSEGSIGAALGFLTDRKNDIASYRKYTDEMISALFAEDSVCTSFGFIQLTVKRIKSGDDLKCILKFMIAALRDIEIKKRGINTDLLYYSDGELPEEYSYSVSENVLLSMLSYLNSLLFNSDVPTNTTVSVTEFACGVWSRKAE